MIYIRGPRTISIVLVVVGALLIAVGSWFGAESALFALDGSTVTGTVVAKHIDPDRFKSTGSGSTRDPNGYFLTVTFTPGGGHEIQSDLLVDHDAWDGYVVGQSVEVSYVRSFPDTLNTLGDTAGGSIGAAFVALVALLAGLLFLGMGLWLLISRRRQAHLLRRMLDQGVSTTGTVIDNDAAELWLRGNLQRRLRYEYTDASGAKQTGLSDWMPRKEALGWDKLATGVVRYDPHKPSVSAWFGKDERHRAATPRAPGS